MPLRPHPSLEREKELDKLINELSHFFSVLISRVMVIFGVSEPIKITVPNHTQNDEKMNWNVSSIVYL
jgi:hypothetical protein